MKLGYERAYRNISSYVPPQARAVLENEVKAIEYAIDEEVTKFGETLSEYIKAEVAATTASVSKELEETRSQLAEQLASFIDSQDGSIDALNAAAKGLQQALDKEKATAEKLGETAREAVVKGLKASGLPIP